MSEHKFCTVFEKELGGVWPFVDETREARFAEIKAFAKTRGWSATILDPGIRVTYRRLDEEVSRRDLAETSATSR